MGHPVVKLGAQISHCDEALFLWYENNMLIRMSVQVNDFFEVEIFEILNINSKIVKKSEF